jgi:hypothetical protein
MNRVLTAFGPDQHPGRAKFQILLELILKTICRCQHELVHEDLVAEIAELIVEAQGPRPVHGPIA